MTGLIIHGQQVSRVCVDGKPAYVFSHGRKILLPGPNLWWPKVPQVTIRAGLTVKQQSDGRWHVTGTHEAKDTNLGGWYQIPAGRYRLDPGTLDPRISLFLTGVPTVKPVGDGLWDVPDDVRCLLYVRCASSVGDVFDVLTEPTMIRVS